jgi:hypothetical protein
MTRDDGYRREIRRRRCKRPVFFDGEAEGCVFMFYAVGKLADVGTGRSVLCYSEVWSRHFHLTGVAQGSIMVMTALSRGETQCCGTVSIVGLRLTVV